ncbi:MAG: fumarylacetoacetate hydrolase family protein [Acidobacteriota bacterium]|jgi:2-keto-4-pentenoate hydratase/2-oxohepta-3-ene-1,7-dioic acid hydratase in catechol pathway
MKLCRFKHQGEIGCGRVEGSVVTVCRGDLLGVMEPTGVMLPLEDVRLLAPLLPGKIIGIGRNYAAHAKEFGNAPPEDEPMIFLKPPSAVISPADAILLPAASRRVDHEAELGVVIGRMVRNIPDDDDPLRYVLGYTCVNDVTARDLQKKDVQFTRAKGFDTFCPIGPWIETEFDPADVMVTGRVNGEVRQQGRTSQMVFPVQRLIKFLAGIMTLMPGDLIATGTPAGVGPLASGDMVEVEVEGIGILRNPVD